MPTFIIYQSVLTTIDDKKLLDQSIRLFFTLYLLYEIYSGKQWARVTSTILFSVAIVLSLFTLINNGIKFYKQNSDASYGTNLRESTISFCLASILRLTGIMLEEKSRQQRNNHICTSDFLIL